MRETRYRLGYRGDIEGLRAIAIVLVVAAHAGVPFLRGGFVGVDIFFVLSGYLITGLLLQEIGDSGGVRFGAFYARRLQRLLPALLLMLLVVSLLALLLVPPPLQPFQAIGGATAAVWLSNVHFALLHLDYFGPGADSNLFLHTWSLGVEEQFYLAWPLLLFVTLGAWRLPPHALRLRRLKVVMLLVFAVSLAACVLWTRTAPQLAFYLMPARAWEFALGALVFMQARPATLREAEGAGQRAADGGRRMGLLAGALGLLLIAAAALLYGPDMPYPGIRALLPALGAAALLYAGAVRADAGVARWLSARPLQGLGKVSYSWYLWHWPILLLGAQIDPDAPLAVRLALALLALLLAVLSYRLVESPIRRSRGLLARPYTVIGTALGLMLLANVGAITWYNDVSAWLQAPRQQQLAAASVDAPVIYSMGCDTWYRSAKVNVCGFGPANAAHTAVLMGDSVGAQWFPAVQRAFERPGWRLLVITKSSCPMVDGTMFYPRIGSDYTVCSTWRARALRYVAQLHPAVLLLGSTATYGFSRAHWIDGTREVLAAVAGDVRQIDLIRSTPHLSFDGPGCLLRRRWLGDLNFLDHCTSPAESATNTRVWRWLGEAAQSFRNVRLLDMNRYVCPHGQCSAQRHGIVVFRDDQHMTASFARSLAGALRATLDAASETRTGRAIPGKP